MSINYYRYVGYEDDGVNRFQCLRCYGEWGLRWSSSPFVICPLCCTHWEGQLDCIEHGMQHNRENWPERKYFQVGYHWVIEERWSGFTKETSPWEWKYVCDGRWSARHILDMKRQFQADHQPIDPDFDFKYEYRIRIVREPVSTSSGTFYPNSSSPCWPD